MPDCECLPTCPFFNDKMANMPVTAGMIKKGYCKTDNAKCARHMVKAVLGKEHVPSSLYPNQIEKAVSIIAQAKSADSK